MSCERCPVPFCLVLSSSHLRFCSHLTDKFKPPGLSSTAKNQSFTREVWPWCFSVWVQTSDITLTELENRKHVLRTVCGLDLLESEQSCVWGQWHSKPHTCKSAGVLIENVNGFFYTCANASMAECYSWIAFSPRPHLSCYVEAAPTFSFMLQSGLFVGVKSFCCISGWEILWILVK